MAESGQEATIDGSGVAPKGWRISMRRIAARYAALGAVGSAIGGVLPWAGGSWFLLELGSHFQHAYLLIAVASLVLLFLLRNWYLLPVAGIAIVATGLNVGPCYIGAHYAPGAGTPLRMMTVNVLTVNRRTRDLEALIVEAQPDVVALQEVDEAWVRALEEMADTYPFQKFDPRSDNFGIGILSRIPLESVALVDLFGVNAIRAELVVGGARVTVVNVHTLPPASPSYATIRNRQLQRVAAMLKNIDGPVIVLGDLNATMWSPNFRDFLAQTGLRDARKGFGVVSTWPVGRLPIMIPIDHCLYRPPLRVDDFRRGERFGSDHLPLIVDFTMPHQDAISSAS